MRPSAHLVVAFALLAAPGAAARAQRPTSRVTGRVVDRAAGTPIRFARVTSLLDGSGHVADSVGAFAVRDLPMGIARFIIRAPGFREQGLIVALAQDDSVDRLVEMDSVSAPATGPIPGAGQPLAAVTVEGAPPMDPRLADFERRRRTGFGQYIDRVGIERSGAYTLQDVIGRMKGVFLDCAGSGCQVRMSRSNTGDCLPDWYLDGYLNNNFGPLTPIRDVAALEVYLGASDVPGEFAGRTAGCGAVIVWTRSGPKRKSP